MHTIKIWNDEPAPRQIAEIADALSRGGLVIMPTDSVYAITCDALSPKSIDRLCSLKGINTDKQTLSIICSDISMAAEYAAIGDTAFAMLKRNTPGPFTWILKASRMLPKVFKGRRQVGIRIPDTKVCREVAEKLGHPLLTTSIDLSDEDYAREPELIAEKYDGKADMMVDGGEGAFIPTAIIAFDDQENEYEIIREGLREPV